MKKLIPLLGLCAACGMFAAESNPSPYKWENAVKADVPSPSEQPAIQVNSIAQSSKASSVPLFYSAVRNIPPLPFNPHPGLPLFDLGENRFLYDDSQIDFVSLLSGSAMPESEGGGASAMSSPAPCNPCSTNGSGGGGYSFSGGPAYSYSSTQLWVKITSTGSTNFLLDVNNTVSGTTYGVLAKNTVDTDPYNTWSLVNVFHATSTNKQLSGIASAATRFYAAVNLDAYVGPTVSIVSPATGATVSNDLPVQVRITDILPLLTLKVYVDAVQVGVIPPGQNGTVSIPTYLFANGSHEIWVAAGNEGVPVDIDGDSVSDSIQGFEGGAGVTVNFTNDVAMLNYSPLYSKAGSLTLQYGVMSPQDYTFEVSQTNGTLLHTASGTSSGSSISRTWNFTDISGNPVTNGVYVFSLTYSPHTGGGGAAAAQGRGIIVTNFVDNGVSVGKYVISYGTWPSSSLNDGLEFENAFISSLVNAAWLNSEEIIGPNRDDYNPIYADGHSDPFPIRKNTQTNDLTALTNALKDTIVGSWLFDGHSGINNLIHGTDQYLTVDLSSRTVARLLGNPYNNFIMSTNQGPLTYNLNYGRRLFSTMIMGCNSSMNGSEWPDVTGTPTGVDQESNPQIRKTAFLGFVKTSKAGSTSVNWTDRIHFEWIDGDEYNTEISTALWRANLAYPTAAGWQPKLFGHSFLEYRANESW